MIDIKKKSWGCIVEDGFDLLSAVAFVSLGLVGREISYQGGLYWGFMLSIFLVCAGVMSVVLLVWRRSWWRFFIAFGFASTFVFSVRFGTADFVWVGACLVLAVQVLRVALHRST
ncbi:MAG: hypothetical protein ABIH41_00545 [Nanoarchaeota archaeon]